MRKFQYRKVDAFTSGGSSGNPAAYLHTGSTQLTEEEMLAVAKEHKGFVSEVVFCSGSKVADMKLTYYSSECEVDFCGHGTVATMVDIIRNDSNLRNKSEIILETNKKGLLTVYNRLDTDNAVYITAPKAQWLPISVSPDEVSAALGFLPEAISCELPLDFIDAGLRTLIVPIAEFNDVVFVYPEMERLKEFCLRNGIDIILIFCIQTSSPGYCAHTRVFAPKFGYLEDPATGSGNSAFANYMLKYNLWDGSPVKVEQGGDNRVFNSVSLMKMGDHILFGGSATLRIAGEYYL
ncbi:MAG: PhzF family phenazine biosynthesis protein [Thermoclostridium sp.]|nr:PhzF family phenazine biosynthesis protein [Thermoclostridium sp.]